MRLLTGMTALLTAALFCTATINAQTVLRSYVIASGGGAASNGTMIMVGTIGQAVIGPTSAASIAAGQGFWYTLPRRTNAVHEERTGTTASGLQLSGNYPNPFSISTQVTMTLPASGNVSLNLYDGIGRVVRTVADGYRQGGTYTFTITSEDMESGRYTLQLIAGGQRRTVAMTVVK